jgi:CopG-like RHH_1 or ribbon-helix-helix domain, RHH_5
MTALIATMQESKQIKRVAVTLPDDARSFLENEAKETGVPLSNLISYIAVNYVRDEKKKRAMQ